MKKRILSVCASLLLVATGLVSGAAGAVAQTSVPGVSRATDVTRAELRKVQGVLGQSIDQQIKVVDIGSGTNVAIGVLSRAEMATVGDSVAGLIHHQVTEIYYVLEGSATLVTGGSIEPGREWPADSRAARELVGPSQGASSRDGRSRKVSAGDIVVIPAGVFHGFSDISDEISYLSFRVDPDQVLPAGYVHPVLQDAAPE